jgi:cytochrome b6-f complex iron-sulfur subunit
VGRRRFLGASLAALAAGFLAEAGGIAAAFLAPLREEGAGGRVRCGRADQLAPGEVKLIPEGHLYIVRRDEGFLALSQRCTHLGCLVPWDPATGAFRCHCHGGTFDNKGLVVAGPPPRPLDVVPLTIEGGELIADTGRAIRRKGWDPAQVVKG